MTRAVSTLAVLFSLLVSAWAEDCAKTYPASSRGFGTSLEKAADAGDYNCVKELLEGGANPNQNNRFGYRPVQVAADQIPGIMQLLLEYGADPTYGQYEVGPPLVIAACHGSEEIVRLLVDAGAPLEGTNGDGKTAAEVVCTCDDAVPNCPKDSILGLLGGDFAVSFNIDYPSSDGLLNDGRQAKTNSNRECMNLCTVTSGCKAWTRIKRTKSGGSKEGECWLRNYQPASKDCDTCDSGTI